MSRGLSSPYAPYAMTPAGTNVVPAGRPTSQQRAGATRPRPRVGLLLVLVAAPAALIALVGVVVTGAVTIPGACGVLLAMAVCRPRSPRRPRLLDQTRAARARRRYRRTIH